MSTFAERITANHDPIQVEASLLNLQPSFRHCTLIMLVLVARNDQQLVPHHVGLDLRQLEIPVEQILTVLFIQAILGKLPSQ